MDMKVNIEKQVNLVIIGTYYGKTCLVVIHFI
jgi:hypothetical protein